MNNDEAKFILHAYRSDGRDATDPQLAEALAQARRDPELARWLAEQTALDTAISNKLQTVPVPVDLKISILAGRKIMPLPVTPWWRIRVHPAATVATLAVTFGLIGYLTLHEPPGPKANLESFTRDITDYLGKGYGVLPRQAHLATMQVNYFGAQSYRMNYRSTSLEDIRHWLRENGGHSEFAVPSNLQKPLSFGCAIMEWRGHRVTLLAFQTGRSLPQDKVHLVIINYDALPDAPNRSQPRVAEGEDWTTAAWTEGPLTYLLMAPGDREAMGKYF